MQLEWHESKLAEVEKRLGTHRARRIRLANHAVFPNHVLGFRLALPRGPFQTEFWHFHVMEADMPQDVIRSLAVASADQNGASGVFEQDDMDNWGQVTMAGRSPVARKHPAFLNLGVGHAEKREDYPGNFSERYISEHNQRNYYQRWEEFMNADSWSDIHVDPITVNFEGTATLHG